MTKKVSIPVKGRPREFDREQALELALRVFWAKGFEGASLNDLTAAMGINRPSLYAVFGDKEALFRAAVDRYEAQRLVFGREALAKTTAREVVEHLLFGVVKLVTGSDSPGGCLMVQSALVSGESAESICADLTTRRTVGEMELRRRLQRAKSEGDLPAEANAGDLARYVMTVVRGMAVQAAGGATRAELRRVAQTALRAWPN